MNQAFEPSSWELAVFNTTIKVLLDYALNYSWL
jgi:hypothetical protein